MNILVYQCKKCGSDDLKKNGRNRSGNQQYICKVCGAYQILTPEDIDTLNEKQQAIFEANYKNAFTHIKEYIQNHPNIDWKDKFDVTGVVSVQYNIPIGLVNQMFCRIARANNVRIQV